MTTTKPVGPLHLLIVILAAAASIYGVTADNWIASVTGFNVCLASILYRLHHTLPKENTDD